MAADLDVLECTTCGAKYTSTAKYCGKDGTALRPKSAGAGTAAHNTIRCPVCAGLYPHYAKFCSNDGTPLKAAANKGTQVAANPAPAASHSTGEEIIGQMFAGKYKIDSLLGEGGMAKVYLAVNEKIDKTVVIKLMHDQLPSRDRETTLKRFLQEIKVSAKLNHPNLVSVFDGGELDGRPFLVMEYIQGESLRQYIGLQGTASTEEAINITNQILSGLQEAHKGGIIHRDLKPENIMLREDADRPDWVKVVDFGIASLKHGGSKLTATGIAIGTVDYMSPEYLADKPIDHRSDIYAVGVILFELLTGHCPFEAESAKGVMAKHLWGNAQAPSEVRHGLQKGCAIDRIVERSLRKEPGERYQSADEMRKDLMKALHNPT